MGSMENYFVKLSHHFKVLFKDKAYTFSLFIGIVVFSLGAVSNYLVSVYNDTSSYKPVGDLILDRIPTYNLEFMFTWGIYFLVFLMVAYPVFVKPEIGPFMFKTFGILLFVRSVFIILTHVGPPTGFFYADGIDIGYNPLKELIFRNDLFFSGHVAIPFLAFLLFKESKLFKWIMLIGSFVMSATVLMMHVHYSIDVFAAFFITYGVYALSNKIFNDLNVRFSRRIKLYGWNAIQKRIATLKMKKNKVIKSLMIFKK